MEEQKTQSLAASPFARCFSELDMLPWRALDFLKVPQRPFGNQPQHSVGLVGFELSALDEGAHSLSRQAEYLARFLYRVELVGDHR